MRDPWREKRLAKVLDFIKSLDIQKPLVIFHQPSSSSWDNYRLIATLLEDLESMTVCVLGTFEGVVAKKPDLIAVKTWVSNMQKVIEHISFLRDGGMLVIPVLMTGDRMTFIPKRCAFSLPNSVTPWMGPPEPIAPAEFVERYKEAKKL